MLHDYNLILFLYHYNMIDTKILNNNNIIFFNLSLSSIIYSYILNKILFCGSHHYHQILHHLILLCFHCYSSKL